MEFKTDVVQKVVLFDHKKLRKLSKTFVPQNETKLNLKKYILRWEKMKIVWFHPLIWKCSLFMCTFNTIYLSLFLCLYSRYFNGIIYCNISLQKKKDAEFMVQIHRKSISLQLSDIAPN